MDNRHTGMENIESYLNSLLLAGLAWGRRSGLSEILIVEIQGKGGGGGDGRAVPFVIGGKILRPQGISYFVTSFAPETRIFAPYTEKPNRESRARAGKARLNRERRQLLSDDFARLSS